MKKRKNRLFLLFFLSGHCLVYHSLELIYGVGFTRVHKHAHTRVHRQQTTDQSLPSAECASLLQALRHPKMRHKLSLSLSLFISFSFSHSHTCTHARTSAGGRESCYNRIFSWKWEQAAQEQEA